MTVKLLVGDVRDRIREIPDGSVDLVACSPPFLALRKYGDNTAEMGSERNPADFLDALLELTGEFRRVLTPHGSIAIELGDTYSGSGGAGGDYNEGGIRANRPRFRQGYLVNDGRTTEQAATRTAGETRNPGGNGWPLAKSLTLIPTLYPASLAYGWNMLNPAHTFPRWRVRNIIVWARPNPPVGALGDKVRPATSYITIACTSVKRWFDLDAVRGNPDDVLDQRVRTTNGMKNRDGDASMVQTANYMERIPSNPAGAPPLDWWNLLIDRVDGALRQAARGEMTQADLFGGEEKVGKKKQQKETAGGKLLREAWEAGEVDMPGFFPMTTQGYPGAHYATWPEKLAARLIEMMCPLRVCTECGESSRRIVGGAEYVPSATNRGGSSFAESERVAEGANQWVGPNGAKASVIRQAPTLGWSDCGHNAWRPGRVLDPFAGSGTTLAVAQGLGRDATGIELYDANADLVRDRVGMFLEMT